MLKIVFAFTFTYDKRANMTLTQFKKQRLKHVLMYAVLFQPSLLVPRPHYQQSPQVSHWYWHWLPTQMPTQSRLLRVPTAR